MELSFHYNYINAIVVQLVVRHLAKVEVASSSLVYRSKGTERSVPFFVFSQNALRVRRCPFQAVNAGIKTDISGEAAPV